MTNGVVAEVAQFPIAILVIGTCEPNMWQHVPTQSNVWQRAADSWPFCEKLSLSRPRLVLIDWVDNNGEIIGPANFNYFTVYE